ncbi:Bcr/CflA family multidrug efflux MFS transporter [Elizabethkingia sp. JS20170427COW]|uniref:Bcr/CflA family multidrug efflux MFS transporter n=1 Tax=Elizabethkingia sp. JS20170427COW TaxID=2583851 RepID=UPI00111059B1|nr:Bcr/CflA family multidrug efflux MFS transporter [Elizabethkingia sp. JS20170427COW]QCX54287.1 Bcr/CflA family multidrug efflux MFS transporter [Elizabethkingia sp. JS20170427COW]
MQERTESIKLEKETSSAVIIAILGALMAMTSLSVDIYLPAMPAMQKALQGNVELTVTGFLIGFSIAQIFWGPISDKFGRKKPLFIGLLLFIIGSVGCALSQTMTEIIFWRIIQALGACTGPMISRAMVRDMYGKTKAAEMLSTLMVVMAIAPIAGPLLGGELLVVSSWHSIFWLLAIIGILLLISIRILPETLPEERKIRGSLQLAFAKYKLLFKNRPFMVYTLCVTFYYVGIYAFLTGSPLVYIEYFGVKPDHYGYFFGVNVIGLMGVSSLNRRLVRRFSLDVLLKVSTVVSMLASLVLLILAKLEVGGILGVMIPIFIVFSTNGIIAACTNAAALDKVPKMAGSGAALLGSFQYGGGIISSVLLALFVPKDGNPWTMAWIIALFVSLSALVIFIGIKREK